MRCVVGHGDIALFEIEDSNGDPINVIIRTRVSLVYVERTSRCNSSMSFDSDWIAMMLALVAACVAAGWKVAVART